MPLARATCRRGSGWGWAIEVILIDSDRIPRSQCVTPHTIPLISPSVLARACAVSESRLYGLFSYSSRSLHSQSSWHLCYKLCFFILLGPYVTVYFSHSGYRGSESDGRVAVAILASRYNFYKSFSVKIKSSVNTRLTPYGMVK